jgi:DnaJ-domain-containing protein 1
MKMLFRCIPSQRQSEKDVFHTFAGISFSLLYRLKVKRSLSRLLSNLSFIKKVKMPSGLRASLKELFEGQEDLYAILGVDKKAKEEEIKRAYRRSGRPVKHCL